MKIIISLLLLGVTLVGNAQTREFKPKWKDGDQKFISMAFETEELENDVSVSDTSMYKEALLRVIGETDFDYSFELIYENQAITAAKVLYDNLGEDLKDYRDMKLQFSIKKETYTAAIMDWKGTRDFMNESFDQITEVIEKQNPEMAEEVEKLLLPVRKIFKNRGNVENYILESIGEIFIPFVYNFRLNSPVTTTYERENPFDPTQEVTATTIMTLESVDSSTGECVMKKEVTLDLRPNAEKMKQAIMNMPEFAGAKVGGKGAKTEEKDDIERAYVKVQTVYYNSKTGWVRKVITNEIISTTDLSDGNIETKQTAEVMVLK